MSLKSNGKTTITVEIEFDMDHFKNHNVSKLTGGEWDKIEEMLRHRLESLPDGFFWDMFDEFVEEELEEMGHPSLGLEPLHKIKLGLDEDKNVLMDSPGNRKTKNPFKDKETFEKEMKKTIYRNIPRSDDDPDIERGL